MKFQPFDPRRELFSHRKNLPHWRQRGATYFITTRLGDSLPQTKLTEWHDERRTWLRAHGLASPDDIARLPDKLQWQFREWFQARLQRWLDAGHGSCWLRRPEIARLVADSLAHFDSQHYALDAWVVMPNHLHALLAPLGEHTLGRVLQSLKGFTARSANGLLGRAGTFWQEEGYDRIVRNERELRHWRRYIAQNPVKARLREGEYLLGMGSGVQESGTDFE